MKDCVCWLIRPKINITDKVLGEFWWDFGTRQGDRVQNDRGLELHTGKSVRKVRET